MTEAQKNPRHSGRQRIFVLFNICLALATILAGSGLLFANWKLSNRKVVSIDNLRGDGSFNLPTGDLSAKNYLVTGADNNSCIDKNSKYAGGFGNRATYGERSDTIMIIRVTPSTNSASILSFPRDMWVKIAGSNRRGRINTTSDKKDPNRLIRTIKENFNIDIDHYVNIDFCAFKEVVDAVGGVRVPFLYQSKDKMTGFDVRKANVCYRFSGDHALAYVRSRHYRYFDPTKNKWVSDGTSDWGRINRQQDFTKRMVKKALDKARTDPRVATGILNAGLKNVITDDRLSPIMLLQLGQAMKNYDANTMGSYTMPGIGQMIDKASVIVPDLELQTAKNILAVFQGKANISKSITATTIVPTALAGNSDGISIISATLMIVTTSTTSTTSPPPTAPAPTTTLPDVSIEQNPRGIVPPNDPGCQF